jgi:hypothetical protein
MWVPSRPGNSESHLERCAVKVDRLQRATLTCFILEKKDIGADSAEPPVGDSKCPIEKLCKQSSDSISMKGAQSMQAQTIQFGLEKKIYT